MGVKERKSTKKGVDSVKKLPGRARQEKNKLGRPGGRGPSLREMLARSEGKRGRYIMGKMGRLGGKRGIIKNFQERQRKRTRASVKV